MMNYFKLIQKMLKKIWIEVFWENSTHLWALKVTVSITFLLIPAEIIFGNSFVGTTLALGVVAMALGETDVHPRGRLKSAATALMLFFFVSALTELLLPFPSFFAPVFGVLVFSLTLLGGINFRLQGVTFGAMLIIVYTMLGSGNSERWFYQPLLYTAGASCYSIISISLLYFRPLRLLREQLASGFDYLSDYIDLKATLFPSEQPQQVQIRNQLAQKNTRLAQQIESCKQSLYSYASESGKEKRDIVNTYFRTWFLLQEIQERATSSHEQYDILSYQVGNRELIEGFGRLMHEIAGAMRLYARSLLIDAPYIHPVSLKWTVTALKNMLDADKKESHYATLSLLMDNLMALEKSLVGEDNAINQIDIETFTSKKPRQQSLCELLTPHHPRFRFAVRLTLCLLVGYGIMFFFHIEKGAWILLTSIIVFQQTYSATRLRFYHRVFGTLLGVVLGVTLAHLLPTFWGQILLLLGSIYAFFYWLKKNYVIAAIFITTFVLAAFNLLSHQGIAVMLPRIIDTLLGGLLAYLVVRFVWTDWQYRQLPELLLNAMDKNKRYFESVYGLSVSENDYLHNRRTAHNADNALTMTWRGMRIEPKSKQAFQEKAFNLTNLNHALLSYLSAFGAHKKSHRLTDTELHFCVQISHTLEFVSQSLREHINEEQYAIQLQSAYQNEAQIVAAKIENKNPQMALIYNIARVSRELLAEAKGIRTLYGKEKREQSNNEKNNTL